MGRKFAAPGEDDALRACLCSAQLRYRTQHPDSEGAFVSHLREESLSWAWAVLWVLYWAVPTWEWIPRLWWESLRALWSSVPGPCRVKSQYSACESSFHYRRHLLDSQQLFQSTPLAKLYSSCMCGRYNCQRVFFPYQHPPIWLWNSEWKWLRSKLVAQHWEYPDCQRLCLVFL